MDSRTFYDDIASVYDHAYDDWPASVKRQAAALDANLQKRWDRGRTAC